MAWSERDYLAITVDQARAQWRQIQNRSAPTEGTRQGSYLPVETLLTNAAMVLINHKKFSSKNRHLVGFPVPQIAAVLRRPTGSIMAKMPNLDGGLKNGGRVDALVGATLNTESDNFSVIYRVLFDAARSVGIGPDQLPDFLDLEPGGELELLGQQTLTSSSVEAVLDKEVPEFLAKTPELNESETERLLYGLMRVGQHRFAKEVIHNCGGACVFCGMTTPTGTSQSLLIASHVKPWRDGTSRERLDYRNGLAACPTHDKAFDTGLLTLTKDLEVRLSPRLQSHIECEPAARAAFGSPPLRSTLDITWREAKVGGKYIAWHREQIFQA